MTRPSVALTAGLMALLTVGAAPATAQSPADFYKGKTVQFMVGYPPGGGFDAYTRAAARYIGKYIPGTPNVIVTNMPGAASLQFVRYMQSQAPKDGTQFGMFDRGLMPKSVLEPKETGVDFSKFTWIGSMNNELIVCYTWGAKGVTKIDQVKNHKLTLGGTSKNSGGYIYASIMRSIFPDNIRPVLGYATTGDIWLAIERGEVDGNCTMLTSVQSQRPEWLAQKKVDILIQFGGHKHPDLPDVPTIFELLKDENQKQAIAFISAAEAIGRPVIGPPGMVADRTAALRKAFLDTMKDPEFLALAKKAQLDIDVVDAAKAAAIAKEIQDTPKEAVELARKLMD